MPDIEGAGKRHPKKTAEALDDFQEALKINPGSEEALQFMGLAYLQEADIANARSSFKELVRLDPDLYDPRVRLAELDLRSGDFQSAIDNVEVTARKRGERTGSLFAAGLGVPREKRSRQSGGRPFRNTWRKIRGMPVESICSAWRFAVREKRRKRSGISRRPSMLLRRLWILWQQLVSIDIAEKNLDSALKRVTKQIEISPANAELYRLLGRVHIVRKEMDQAEAAYLKAIEIDPKLVQAFMDLAQVYAVTKKFDKALVKLDEVIKIDPKNIGALMLSGILHQQREDIPKGAGGI